VFLGGGVAASSSVEDLPSESRVPPRETEILVFQICDLDICSATCLSVPQLCPGLCSPSGELFSSVLPLFKAFWCPCKFKGCPRPRKARGKKKSSCHLFSPSPLLNVLPGSLTKSCGKTAAPCGPTALSRQGHLVLSLLGGTGIGSAAESVQHTDKHGSGHRQKLISRKRNECHEGGSLPLHSDKLLLLFSSISILHNLTFKRTEFSC